MTHQTARQSKDENIQIMGDELGAVYSALWQELARIHQKWHQYVTLFGTSPERIALLNEVAPQTTHAIQESLWLDIVLHIARLVDSPQTGKGTAAKQNLSVARFKIILKDSPLSKEVEDQIEKVKDSAAFAKDWRDRTYAHMDLAIALGYK